MPRSSAVVPTRSPVTPRSSSTRARLEGGQIQLAGKTTDEAPYGIAFKKGSPLAPVFQKAVTKLMQDGTYTKIINTWKLQAGAITESKINGANG